MNTIGILVAEDDPDDCEITEEALRRAGAATPVHFVKDGAELVEYLKAHSDKTTRNGHVWPALILLDLNMPRMDGFGAIKEIKSDPVLASIPIVVLSTSDSERDIEQTYRMGAQSYVVKPSRLDEWIDKFRAIDAYWFKTVELPE